LRHFFENLRAVVKILNLSRSEFGTGSPEGDKGTIFRTALKNRFKHGVSGYFLLINKLQLYETGKQ